MASDAIGVLNMKIIKTIKKHKEKEKKKRHKEEQKALFFSLRPQLNELTSSLDSLNQTLKKITKQ